METQTTTDRLAILRDAFPRFGEVVRTEGIPPSAFPIPLWKKIAPTYLRACEGMLNAVNNKRGLKFMLELQKLSEWPKRHQGSEGKQQMWKNGNFHFIKGWLERRASSPLIVWKYAREERHEDWKGVAPLGLFEALCILLTDGEGPFVAAGFQHLAMELPGDNCMVCVNGQRVVHVPAIRAGTNGTLPVICVHRRDTFSGGMGSVVGFRI